MADAHVLLPFERTAGDEIQGLVGTVEGVVGVVRHLVRLRNWRIGVGLGAVDQPLTDSTRAARGTAYLAARAAVEQARGVSVGIALRDGREEAEVSASARRAVWLAESGLLLWAAVLTRRTAEGWEMADLLDSGLSNNAAAAALRITPSAASQRAGRAAYAEADRGAWLVAALLEQAAVEGTRR
ncbi:transposase [Raineyella fluvialis]|uniref:Transposase n=1 Tax=Raineyella fluvialis TaxID=2662261 RepID=A0A5Q2FJY2_9ACTN|nr:transposase [Raineyella fluvialis]QGF24646.1 transposase [Raineyella fluvialis]